ncbi:hypothetical protein PCL_10542 [Purpureocillium lilacinum]|uniref:Alpha-1,3-mannosyltransferase CMT1 n=1 Tax=Purpureocillium lilacinum TaxID=33203 RepID=A0A2U3DQ37_PURLI|nr:hypothetical protein PCL_10542 [Purpureocillium lilacinum]
MCQSFAPVRLLRRRLHLLALLSSTILGILYFGRLHLLSYYIHDEELETTAATRPHVIHAPSQTPANGVSDGHILTAGEITTFLAHIPGKTETQLPTVGCPDFDSQRYSSLQAKSAGLHYFFALDLRKCLPILPQLLRGIIAAIEFLGTTSCVLSIVEGNSDDGTHDLLSSLRSEMDFRGIQYFLHASSIDTSHGDRIGKLADLRNLALEPLLQGRNQLKPSSEAEVVFLNDVALCPDDILELLLQRRRLNATMTCAMDWHFAGQEPTFYDVWVTRGINGDTFFDIPTNGSWDLALNLLWNADEDIRSRFRSHRPFPVFSCWNGAVVFKTDVVLEHGVRFRSSNAEVGECFQGEPQLFCKDLWFRGLGKVAVVPSVNLEYSVERGRRIKEVKGFTAELVASQKGGGTDAIKWPPPPETVKCMPTWQDQSWRPWNETLAW